MDHLNDALNYFKQSESEVAVELRKLKSAQLIIGVLGKLRADVEKVRTGIECEIAVVEAQQIIDGE